MGVRAAGSAVAQRPEASVCALPGVCASPQKPEEDGRHGIGIVQQHKALQAEWQGQVGGINRLLAAAWRQQKQAATDSCLTLITYRTITAAAAQLPGMGAVPQPARNPPASPEWLDDAREC